MINIRIEKGQEVMEVLNARLAEAGVQRGAIISVIGAVDRCVISNMPEGDAMQDIITEYNKPFEMLGCGEVIDGKAHIDCTLGQEGDRALAGHLHRAQVESWYVSVYVQEMDG